MYKKSVYIAWFSCWVHDITSAKLCNRDIASSITELKTLICYLTIRCLSWTNIFNEAILWWYDLGIQYYDTFHIKEQNKNVPCNRYIWVQVTLVHSNFMEPEFKAKKVVSKYNFTLIKLLVACYFTGCCKLFTASNFSPHSVIFLIDQALGTTHHFCHH